MNISYHDFDNKTSLPGIGKGVSSILRKQAGLNTPSLPNHTALCNTIAIG
jgi:hypothetical protein